MNSIYEIIKDKSLWFVAISIVALFFVIPVTIFDNTYVVGFAFILLVLYTLFSNKIGFTCIVFSYSLMMPYGDVGVNTGFSRYIAYMCVFLIWIVRVLFKKKKVDINFTDIAIIMSFLLFISVIYSFKNEMFIETRNMLFYIISTGMLFYISFQDGITLKQFYWILDIIFYLTLLYVIQDSIFNNSPYQNIYKNLDADFQLRAKGLMGHPLLLSSFTSFYQVALITRFLIFKKFSFFNFLLVLPVIVLSASKTLIVLTIVSWLLYIILAKSYKNARFYFAILILIAFAIQIFPFLQLFTDTYFQRIFDSSADQRFGSYSIAWQIMSQNIFGIGLTSEALKAELGKVTYIFNYSYDKRFLIFDNAYLTAGASLGIMAFTLFLIYFSPLKILKKHSLKAGFKTYRNSLLLLLIIWSLQNLSFDSFQYFSVNAFFFMLSAFIVKDFIPVKAHGLNYENADSTQ